MNDQQVKSEAFRKALLASEGRRIRGVTAFLVVMAYELWTLHEAGKRVPKKEIPESALNLAAEIQSPVR